MLEPRSSLLGADFDYLTDRLNMAKSTLFHIMKLQASQILERAQEEILVDEINRLFKEKDFIELNDRWMVINHRKTIYRIMQSYANDVKREVLACTTDTAMTASQIIEKTNLPISSVYREIDELISDGLLLRVGYDKARKKTASKLLALIQNMKIDIDGNKISILIKTNKSNDAFLL